MKTETRVIAQFLATAIWTDGEFSDVEHDFLNEIANDLEIDTLVSEVEAIIPMQSVMTGETLTQTLALEAKNVDAEEKDCLLALCLQMMGADAYLADEEIANFFVLAKLIGIDEERAKMIMNEFVDDDEELVTEDVN